MKPKVTSWTDQCNNGYIYKQRFTMSKELFYKVSNALLAKRKRGNLSFKERLYLMALEAPENTLVFLNLTQRDFIGNFFKLSFKNRNTCLKIK